jgi:hypothetical protein
MQIDCLNQPYENIDLYVSTILYLHEKERACTCKLILPIMTSDIMSTNSKYKCEHDYLTILLDKLNDKDLLYSWKLSHLTEVEDNDDKLDVYLTVELKINQQKVDHQKVTTNNHICQSIGCASRSDIPYTIQIVDHDNDMKQYLKLLEISSTHLMLKR